MLPLLLAPLLFVPSEEGPSRVLVTVTDAAGAPVAGAAVAVHPHRGNARWTGPAADTSTTGPDGSAELVAPADPDAHKYKIVASAPGLAPFGVSTPLAEGGETRAALQLFPAVRPQLRITDAGGNPIAGVSVRDLGVSNPGGDPETGGGFWRRSARDDWAGDEIGYVAEKSGADGRLALPPLPAGGRVWAAVAHPDFAPAAVRLTVGDGEPTPVTLEPGVRVTVRVRPDATAPPGPLGVLKLWLPLDEVGHPSWLVYVPLELEPPDPEGVRTGSLTVAAGNYGLLRLYHPAARFTPHFDEDFELKPGDDRTFEVIATAARPVTGTVLGEDGEPAAGAGIEVFYPNRPAGAGLGWLPSDDADDWYDVWVSVNGLQTVTDAAGAYRTTAPAGPVRVRAVQWVERKIEGVGDTTVDIPPPGSGPATLAIPPVRLAPPADRPGPVTGVVRNPDGTPATGAFVRLRGPLRFVADDYALTAADGSFTLRPRAVPRAADGGPAAPLFACDPLAPRSATVSVDLSDEAARTGVTLTLAPHDPAGDHDLPPREKLDRFYKADDPPALVGEPAPPLVAREILNHDDPLD